MKAYLAGALALVAAAGALAGQSAPQRGQPYPPPIVVQRTYPPGPPIPFSRRGVPSILLAGTQALFDGYVRDGKMPGIIGAFGIGEGSTLFIGAGKQGLEPDARPVDPDTLWRVYSMTKPITGMAAMMLIEDGRLKLDQPISDILPAFKTMRVLIDPRNSLASRPATRPITVRNLLTHTAGLGYSIITTGPLLKEYERLGILPGAVNAQVEAEMRKVRPKSLQAFADRVAKLPLIAEPGTTWSYSIGLDVLGAVIEKASGMSFERFVQTRLFGPLGMKRSYWQVPAGEKATLASNYTFVGDNMIPLDPAATSTFLDSPSFPYGGAGLVMSARDYDRFLHMLADGGTLDGVRVMKAETVALAMSNLLPPGVVYTGAGAGTGGTQAADRMGFGAGGSVSLEDRPGGASRGTYGWGGAAGTIAWIDPVRHVRGTVMVNYVPSDRWPLRSDVAAALFRDAARFRPGNP